MIHGALGGASDDDAPNVSARSRRRALEAARGLSHGVEDETLPGTALTFAEARPTDLCNLTGCVQVQNRNRRSTAAVKPPASTDTLLPSGPSRSIPAWL